MAVNSENQATQAFPNPPAVYYKLYTDENVQSGRAPPPPPPVKGPYHMFGAPFDTNDVMVRPLGEQRLTQVYPNQSDRKMELKKLNRSILVCFLELLDILILNPASPERNTKINNLSILFINMHHLINEYRPHQARETLRVVLERQKSQREDMILQIQRAMDKARGILKSCENFLVQTTAAMPAIMEEEEEGDRAGASEEKMDTGEQQAKAAIGQGLSPVDPLDKQLTDMVDRLMETLQSSSSSGNR